MKEHKIGEVFEDSENFTPAKRMKCVEGDHCSECGYYDMPPCDRIVACSPSLREDKKDVYFIESDEPLTK